MADFDEENDAMSNIFNRSNPSGENFMNWCKNQVLPTHKEIMACFKSLKNRKAVSPKLKDFFPTDQQRLLNDIVKDWVQKWMLANEGQAPWPEKALRVFLMGDPGAGKSSCTKRLMAILKILIGEMYSDVVKQAVGMAKLQTGIY